jgi:hypothetical protein
MNQVIEQGTQAVAMQPQPQYQVATNTPADMLMIAIQQGADLDKLERLMAMQDKHNANLARMAFVDAMAQFKLNAPDIYKDKDVSFNGTTYSHASLGGICAVVIESLAKVGISHSWDQSQKDGMITVACILTHKQGHSERSQLEAPPDNSGKKNGIQQVSSTITYLQRYTLLGVCGLSTMDAKDDDDGRNATPEDTLNNVDVNALIAEMRASKSRAVAQAIWKAGIIGLNANNQVEDYKKFKAAMIVHVALLDEQASALVIPVELQEMINDMTADGTEFCQQYFDGCSKATQAKLTPYMSQIMAKAASKQVEEVAA